MNKKYPYSEHRASYIIPIAVVIMSAVIIVLTAFNPLRYDDIMYQYVCMDMGADAIHFNHDRRIGGFMDVFVSMKNWYFLENGRLLIHFLAQCFCGFLGKPLFNVLNGVVYGFFLYGCLRWLDIRRLYEGIIVVGLLWLALPVQYIFTVSIAYAINYLWVATAMIWYLLLLRKTALSSSPSLPLPLLFLLGFLAGATHEGFMLPLAGSLFFYVLFRWRHLNKQTWVLIIGLWIGVATVVLAPATIHRSSDSMAQQTGDFNDWLMLKAHVLIYSKRVLLLFALLAGMLYVKGRRLFMAFLKEHSVELLTIVFGLVFVAMLPHYSQRMVFPMELLAVLLVVLVLQRFSFWMARQKTVAMIIVLMMLVHVPLTVFCARRVSLAYREMVCRYQQSPEGMPTMDAVYVAKPVNSYIKFPDEFEYKMLAFEYGNPREVNLHDEQKADD